MDAAEIIFGIGLGLAGLAVLLAFGTFIFLMAMPERAVKLLTRAMRVLGESLNSLGQ